jgi:uncharacterized protein (DUF342 family)
MNDAENANVALEEDDSEEMIGIELPADAEFEPWDIPDATDGEKEKEEPAQPLKPVITVRCETHGTGASIELSRRSTEVLPLTVEELMGALEEQGVIYGIDNNLIEQLTRQPVFSEPIIVARATMAETGKDGYVIYHVETKRNLRPKERPDGSVDFHDMGFVQSVSKGELLAEVFEPLKGADGMDIFGNVLDGATGRAPDVPMGKNTEFQQDIGAVIAAVDGHVVVSPKGIIEVLDVLKIAGSVDNSTGNIFFSGDVIVGKDVASNFKIISRGNIIVRGTVEGATLDAKGDITVGEGINGMDRAKIVAGGTLRCKYIQNCAISVTGDVFADSIIFCSLECSGNVELSGKRGGIVGGKTVIAKGLTAKVLGNDKHVPTSITMAAVGLQHNEKILAIKKRLTELDNEMVSLVQTITWCEDLIKQDKLKPFQKNAYENAKSRHQSLTEERPELEQLLVDTQQALLYVSADDSFIKCKGHVHAGVRVIFGMQMLNVQTSFVNSRIYMSEGEIVTSPL